VVAADDAHTVGCKEQKKVVVVENVQNYKGLGLKKFVVVVYARFAVVYARMKDEIGVVDNVDIKNDVMGRYYYCEKRKKESNSDSKNSKRTEELVLV
jgi:hypothetical protein